MLSAPSGILGRGWSNKNLPAGSTTRGPGSDHIDESQTSANCPTMRLMRSPCQALRICVVSFAPSGTLERGRSNKILPAGSTTREPGSDYIDKSQTLPNRPTMRLLRSPCPALRIRSGGRVREGDGSDHPDESREVEEWDVESTTSPLKWIVQRPFEARDGSWRRSSAPP